ncbi:MAG: hypothetical protein NW215_00550 [Hyphomicrobiales bacterium]|nr:hypothetical protein [Hyphomicrobiales bacterium]
MADYYTPTTLEPSIPNRDMTPFERFILTRIYDHEEDGERTYFYSWDGANSFFWLEKEPLQALLRDPAQDPSLIAERVRIALEAEADHHSTDLECTLEEDELEDLLQTILKRSETLTHLAITKAYTCSKMRPGAFGGSITLIRAKGVRFTSTADMLEDWLSEDEQNDPSKANPATTA